MPKDEQQLWTIRANKDPTTSAVVQHNPPRPKKIDSRVHKSSGSKMLQSCGSLDHKEQRCPNRPEHIALKNQERVLAAASLDANRKEAALDAHRKYVNKGQRDADYEARFQVRRGGVWAISSC